MLAAALQAKTHVHEWTPGLELGIVFAKAQTVTFDDGPAAEAPGPGGRAHR